MLGVARLAVPLRAVNAAIRQVMLVVGAALVAAIVIAVGLALWIAGYVTGPLRRLTTVADEVARGSPLAVLGVSHEGEIGRLAEAFNQMADQLKAQMLSLAHERDVLASVLTNMTDGIVVVGQDGQVVIANEAARRLLDMVEAPEGLSLARAVRDHEICATLDEALAHGTRRTEVRRAGRSARHLRVAAAPLRERAGGLLVLRDVTEERRVENLRRDFVANVSHELRTPIAALKALVETLEEGALDDPPAARDFLRRIHVEVDGLAQLVAELLELSRVESGRAQLKLEAVEPDELVRSAAERLQPQAERVGIRLTWDASDDLAPVLADRTRVEHVLLALVHNAIKFTPPGGDGAGGGPGGRGVRAVLGGGHGDGHPGGGSAPDLRAVLQGGPGAGGRRDGAGPGDREARGPGARRRDLGRERGRSRHDGPLHAADGERRVRGPAGEPGGAVLTASQGRA